MIEVVVNISKSFKVGHEVFSGEREKEKSAGTG